MIRLLRRELKHGKVKRITNCDLDARQFWCPCSRHGLLFARSKLQKNIPDYKKLSIVPFQIVICLLAVAQIAVAIEHKHEEHEDEHAPAHYEFHYAVHDPHTGDIKSHKEARKDDKVEGSYELIDSDGHRRLVKYKADKHSGFEAIVLREPTDIKIPIPEQHHKILTTHKIIEHAPIVHYSHKPVIVEKHHSSGGHGHFVSYSGPSHTFKY